MGAMTAPYGLVHSLWPEAASCVRSLRPQLRQSRCHLCAQARGAQSWVWGVRGSHALQGIHCWRCFCDGLNGVEREQQQLLRQLRDALELVRDVDGAAGRLQQVLGQILKRLGNFQAITC